MELSKPAQLEILARVSPSPSLKENFTRSRKYSSVGVKVIALKRVQFGDFLLDPDLAEGQYRPLE